MKTKIHIKSILGTILFEYEKENNTIKDTIIEAVKNGANLGSADLYGADLRGADLGYANLFGADLGRANLGYANLRGADLGYANLYGANLGSADLGYANLYGADLGRANLFGANLGSADLYGADLRGADLYGADLRGADLGEFGKIQSTESVLIVGNIGSRNGTTIIFHTDKGIYVKCGCFKGTIDEFVAKVKETHKGNKHERDYLALVEFVKIKFGLK